MNPTTVPVTLGARSYDVVVDSGALPRAGAHLAPWMRRGVTTIVTDDRVAQHHLPVLRHALEQAGVAVRTIIVPAGEQSKSWATLASVCDQLLDHGVERNDHIIALGGGVIGDLTGFAAAIIKRGVGFVQIPTTLLAQVDSSVGGKTAINTAAGKNLIGAFYQPAHVLIDPATLDTLPRREVAAGYAEVVKYGLIDNAAFFDWCEAQGAALIDGDGAARQHARHHAIVTSVRAKAAIVTDDERETSGRRALLNLGHTFGHALEAEAGFSDRLLHGEAVAAGMALALRYSARRGLCSSDDAERVAAHLRAVGLPDGLAAAGISANGATLAAHMIHDKKAQGGRVPFLLLRGIGQTYVADDVDLSDIAAFLDTEARG